MRRISQFWRGLVPILLGFALLVLASGSIVWLSSLQRDNARSAEHALRLQNRLSRVQTLITEAETGQRGYLLTGRAFYREPYDDARAKLRVQLDDLAPDLTEPAEQEQLSVLKATVFAKIAELQRTIELRAANDTNGAMKIVNDDSGAWMMVRIRDTVELLQAEVRAAQGDRQAQALTYTILVQSALLASIVLVALVAFFTVRDARARMGVIERANERIEEESAERSNAEDQVRQLQKTEALGQLTGGIAHDFNNMLAIIIGSLDIARRRLIGPDHAQILAFIENAIEGAERAALLTARLLAFSRRQPLEPKVVDANKLVGGMSELLRRTLGEQVQIETVLAGGLWRVCADPSQLENALVNLAVNARDAMPSGGKLTIESANSDLDERYAASHMEVRAGQYVMVSVTDTGVGMPPEVAAKAFDPFYTTKGVGKGTGLGLSQVFGFVKQSGGHVKIYSEVEHGTTVKVYLPRYHGEDIETETALPVCETIKGSPDEIILVVEDEPRVRHMAVDALRELGFTVVPAASPNEALQQVELQPSITLMFTDIVMPDMTGKQLADRARQLRPTLKVLFTTGYTRNSIVHNGTLDPGVPFLQKPYTLDRLAAKIRSVLDNEPAP